jgi:uncharacterized membrane protein YwzB
MGSNNLVTSNTAMFAADGLIFMIAFLLGTWYAWRALGILKWDKFVADPHGQQARMLRFLLAMFGGSMIAFVSLVYVIAGQALRFVF